MDLDFFERAWQLSAAGQPFVIATVVRVEKPTSARPGARAIIDAAGELTGWVGGSCAEPVVRRAARQALENGQPILLRLTPPEKRSQIPVEGITEVALACASGGTLEIFIEPQLPQARLVVIGHLPVAQALVGLGKSLGFGVLVAGLEASPERFPQADRVVAGLDFSQLGIRPWDYVVIASHGNYDEEALTAALEAGAAYVALVASKARGQSIMDYLLGAGISQERLARVKFPAGLDIGAETPLEIALSILAEIVQLRHTRTTTVGAGVDQAPSLSMVSPTPAPDPGAAPTHIPAHATHVGAGVDQAHSLSSGTHTPAPNLIAVPTSVPAHAPGGGRAGVPVPGTDNRSASPGYVVEVGSFFPPAPTKIPTPPLAEARDTVCGMMVEVASARYLSEYNGETYYFCAKSCQRAFEADPHKYLAASMRE